MSLSWKIADAQHAIDSFADHIDQPIALAHVKFDTGIFGEEVRQTRHHKMTRQRAVNIHAQQSLRLGAAEGGLRLLDVGNQRQTTPVIGLAVQRGADLPRGPLQQTHAKPRFKLLHGIGDGRARQTEIIRRQREAAPLHDPREHPHRVETVHQDCSSLPDCDAG